jgi:hypothetical protein
VKSSSYKQVGGNGKKTENNLIYKMISDNYLPALERFTIEEARMIKLNPDVNKFYKPDGYYEKMYNFVSANSSEFIPFIESGVHFIEMEFAESVKVIKDKLISLAKEFAIPEEVLFIPTISIEVGKRESIIHIKVAELIRKCMTRIPMKNFKP